MTRSPEQSLLSRCDTHVHMFQSLDAWGLAGSRSDGVFEETPEEALFLSSAESNLDWLVRTTPRGEDAEECIVAQAARAPKVDARRRGREYQ